MEQFLEYLSDVCEKSFHSIMIKSSIIIFGDIQRKKKLLCIGKGVSFNNFISPDFVVRCALTLAEFRDDITIESILSHPVSKIPSSLFHDDGTMGKTKKSDLGEILESIAPKCIELLPFDKGLSVHIRDSMGIIQATDVSQFTTFGQVVYNYRKWLLLDFVSQIHW